MTINKLKSLCAIAIFTTIFIYATKALTVPLYGYMGFLNNEHSLILIYIYALTPSLFIKTENISLSRYIILVFYIVVYIPSIIVIHNSAHYFRISSETNTMSLAMLASMLIVCSQEYIPRLKSPKAKITFTYDGLKKYLWGAAIIMLVISTATQFQFFSFTNLFDVYEKRQSIADSKPGAFRYLQACLTNFILPMLFAISTIKKERRNIIVVCVIYIYLFFLSGHKTFFFAPAFMLLATYACSNPKKYVRKTAYIFTAVVALPIIGIFILPDLFKLYVGMVNVRTFSIQGLAVSVYHDFFSSHPQTLFSQLKFFNLITDYPYNADIPIVLDSQYGLGNYNSHFLMSDGFASYGYRGMIIMSIVFSLYMYFFDSFAKKNVNLFIISTSFYTSTLMNVSLATSLLTFGGAYFILFTLIKIEDPNPAREDIYKKIPSQ